jgi:hypothetical protein
MLFERLDVMYLLKAACKRRLRTVDPISVLIMNDQR